MLSQFVFVLKIKIKRAAFVKMHPEHVSMLPLAQGLRLRAGIVGIERNIEKKQQQTGQQVSQAFKDLDALIDKASLCIQLHHQTVSIQLSTIIV